MYFKGIVGAGLILVMAAGGCRTSPSTTPPSPQPQPVKKSVDPVVRDNSLALLNDLLNDEKNLSKILIIKRNSKELKRLIVDISETSGDGAKMLQSFAKADPSINLKVLGLPPGEVATRKAIAKTKEHLLLHSKDDEFEFQILLTQSEALNYGAHLAKVAAENESNPRRAEELSRLSTHLSQLQVRVLEMLRHRI
jgi:hypothetical protein